MSLQTLYKYDTKGKIRQWSIFTEGDRVIVEHGLQGGKIQQKSTVSKPKSVGRANETTGSEQAILEAQSKWNFQVNREDYHQNVELSGLQTRPMLAMDYLKVPHRVKWDEVVIQPKLDGLRLTAGNRYDGIDKFELMTRKGETYNVHHFTDPSIRLIEIINLMFQNTPNIIALDGEAYLHGLPLGKISSYAKKFNPIWTEQLEYHLFDLVVKDVPFHLRAEMVRAGVTEYERQYGSNPFEIVEHVTITTEIEALHYQGVWMEQGYEGVIIRHVNSMYKVAGRSADLFKFKKFMDDECLITGMYIDDNGNAMLNTRQKNGEMCDVTPKRTHAFRKQMLLEQDQWIGKWINVKFQGYTEYDVMQFPVGRDLRECDEDGNPLV